MKHDEEFTQLISPAVLAVIGIRQDRFNLAIVFTCRAWALHFGAPSLVRNQPDTEENWRSNSYIFVKNCLFWLLRLTGLQKTYHSDDMDIFSSDPFEFIQFQPLKGRRDDIKSPSYYIDSEDFDAKLDRACRAITDEFANRRSAECNRRNALKKPNLSDIKSREAKTPQGGPSSLQWLKPVCYQFILGFLGDNEVFARLETRHRQFGRYPKNPDYELDVFSSGIMAIFAHVKARGDLAFLTEMQRQRLATEMWFALRHFIPAPLINGFNSQYSLHDPKRRCDKDELIPELVDWMVDQFALEMARDIHLEWVRGGYPTTVMEKFNSTYYDIHRSQSQQTKPRVFDDDKWGPDSDASALHNNMKDDNWSTDP